MSYADPFGLKVCFGEKDRGKLVKATEAATNTSITLGKDGCVTSFKPGKKKGFDDLRKRFGTLVSSDNVYTVLSGDTERVGQFVNGTATLDFGRIPNTHYAIQVLGQCVNYSFSTNHLTPASVMAHELLGHAVNGVTDNKTADEEGAVSVENEYHAAANEPTRCAYEVDLSH